MSVDTITFFIPSPRSDKRGHPMGMDGLNEILRQARGNKFSAARGKKEASEYVAAYARMAATRVEWHTPEDRSLVVLSFVEPNRRRDPDNIFAGAKYILDGLTLRGDTGAGLIRDDSQACIDLWCLLGDTDRDKPGVWVHIRPASSDMPVYTIMADHSGVHVDHNGYTYGHISSEV